MFCTFDLDGTLVTSYMDNPDRNFDTWQLLPGRQQRIVQLISEGHQVAIITNQAGVAYGHVDADQVREKLQRVAGALGFGGVAIHSGGAPSFWSTSFHMAENWQPVTKRSLPIFVCYDKDGPRRKPSGAMIREAIADVQIEYFDGDENVISFADVPTLYVGDRPEDEAAAHDAGVRFQWAHEFFQ